MKTITLKIRTTLLEEMLGTANPNPDIHEEFIASKAPNAPSRDEEVAAVGAEEVFEKSMTVFPRHDGKPIVWDYQIKGFFKDACQSLRKVPGSECGKIKSYKKEIDGLIFISPRMIPINYQGEITTCQRPIRCATAQGERVALASSEAIPAYSTIEFEIKLLLPAHEAAVLEMLEYGKLRGFGQWRNSGKGRFVYELLERRED